MPEKSKLKIFGGGVFAPATQNTYTADTLRAGWWREQWGGVRRKERPPSPHAERAAMAAGDIVRLEADSAMDSAHGHSSDVHSPA